MNPTDNLRPREVLTDWLTHYGYDRRRVTGDDHASLAYALIARRGAEGEWRRGWQLVGDSHGEAGNMEEALSSAFETCAELYAEHTDDGADAPYVVALAVLSHAHAQIALGEERSGQIFTAETLPAEFHDALADQDPKMLAAFRESSLRPVPVRTATVVSLEGMACEMSFFFASDPADVAVEVVEDWIHADDSERCEPDGPGVESLHQTFGFLVLIRGTIGAGYRPNLDGMWAYTKDCAVEGHPGAKSMTAFLLRLIASGLDTGALSFDDEGRIVGNLGGPIGS